MRHARYRQVLTWRAEGLAYPEIGRRLGVSRERAQDLARQAQRWQERMHWPPTEQPSHLNPAVTLSVAQRRRDTFPPSRVLP